MDKKGLLYEGKGKKIFLTEDEDFLIAEFKDDLTAFNAQKKGSEIGKGSLNLKITSIIFDILSHEGVKNHYIREIDDNSMLVKKVDIIPIEVIVRNVATGSITRRLGIEDGKILPFPLVELCYKNDDYDDPIITDDHAIIMELVDNVGVLEHLKKSAKEVNNILLPFFHRVNLRLIDFKLEFGIDKDKNVILADEISPDSCRFWDKDSNEKLDKDRFRQDLGSIKSGYEEVLKRIGENS